MKKDDEKNTVKYEDKKNKKCWVGVMLYNKRFEIHCNTRLVILMKAPAALSMRKSN